MQDDDLKEIKERIYVDENIIPLLEALECEGVHEQGVRVFAQLPSSYGSNNKRAVQVKLAPTLPSNIRNKEVVGDIFSIVAFIQYGATTFQEMLPHLYDVKKWVCTVLGYTEYISGNRKLKEKPKEIENISFLKKIKKDRGSKTRHSILRNEPIREDILEEYLNMPNGWWLDDGISIYTQWLFGVRYDIKSERIVFPCHDRYGNLIGVKGRYQGKDKYIKEHMKYIYLHNFNKSLELFNFHRALPYIQERKEILVFEGAKSCMLATQFGYPNCVSIEGDQLSTDQISLLKSTGFDVELVFCYDKDKSEEWILRQLEPVTRRTVSYILDSKNLLENKESVVDRGKEVWHTLYRDNKHIK